MSGPNSPLFAAWGPDCSFPLPIDPGQSIENSGDISTFTSKLVISCRWTMYCFAIAYTRVPSTETRLREGLLPLYDYGCDIYNTWADVARQKGVKLPSCLDTMPVNQDITKEAETDHVALFNPLMASARPAMQEMMRLLDRGIKSNWGVIFPCLIVAFGRGQHGKSAEAMKEKPAGIEETDPVFAAFMKFFSADKLPGILQVIEGELMKCRDAADRTGWNDDEAKAFFIDFLKAAEQFDAMD